MKNDTFLKYVKKLNLLFRWPNLGMYVGFRLKLRPPECTQIINVDEDMLWNIANNFVNYCSNDLKKLPDVVQSTNKSSSELKKYSLNSSMSNKFPTTTYFSGT